MRHPLSILFMLFALVAHNATAHVQAWFAKLPLLADGGVKVVRMEILGNRTDETL